MKTMKKLFLITAATIAAAGEIFLSVKSLESQRAG